LSKHPQGDDKGILASYLGGESCSSGTSREFIVTLTCDPTISTYDIVEDPDGSVVEQGCKYYLEMKSTHACPKSVPFTPHNPAAPHNPGQNNSLSPGSIFLLIFFISLAVYCAAGFIYNTQANNRSGAEAIPNINFWRESWDLVKEGVAFTMNGFSAPDPHGEYTPQADSEDIADSSAPETSTPSGYGSISS